MWYPTWCWPGSNPFAVWRVTWVDALTWHFGNTTPTTVLPEVIFLNRIFKISPLYELAKLQSVVTRRNCNTSPGNYLKKHMHQLHFSHSFCICNANTTLWDYGLKVSAWRNPELLLRCYRLTHRLSILAYQVQMTSLALLVQENQCFNQEHTQGAFWRRGWDREACSTILLQKPERSNSRIESKDEKDRANGRIVGSGSTEFMESSSPGRQNSARIGSLRTYIALIHPYSTLFYLHSTVLRPAGRTGSIYSSLFWTSLICSSNCQPMGGFIGLKALPPLSFTFHIFLADCDNSASTVSQLRLITANALDSASYQSRWCVPCLQSSLDSFKRIIGNLKGSANPITITKT